jgi:hypothetical protein
MKYILLILLTALSFKGFSQVPQSRRLLGQDTLTNTGGRVYLDTLKTLVCTGCSFTHGTYSDTLVVTASGGGGNNIYNVDSTLSANRTVSMAGRTMTFSSNAGARFTLSNSQSTTFALSEILNNSGNGLQFGSWGSAETTSGLVVADYSFLNANGSQALVIQTLNSARPIIFGINTFEQGRFDGTNFKVTGGNIITGKAVIGNTALLGDDFDINGTSGVYSGLYVSGVFKGLTGISGATDQGITGSATGDMLNRSIQKILWSADNGTTAHMALTNGGHLLVGTTTDAAFVTNGNSAAPGRYRAITALRTLDATDYIVNCTANSFTVTLPTAVGITGRQYIIKNTGSSTTITIATTSSQTVDGAAPGTVTTLIPLRVCSDGANWITF